MSPTDLQPFRKRLKPLFARVGIHSSTSFWQPFALRIYRKKLASNAAFRQWFEENRTHVEQHFGDVLLETEIVRLHLASQLYELTEILKQRVDIDGPILDAAASDGLFMSRLGATNAVGINLLFACARTISEDGFPACQADVEQLPFRDKTFNSVLCCQTLEHVPNPIFALNQLLRVARRLYLSVPWLPRTRINARPAGWPQVESHIFEFSTRDFARILTHVDGRVTYQAEIEVFPRPRNPLLDAYLRLMMYPNYFPALTYYEIEPLQRSRLGH